MKTSQCFQMAVVLSAALLVRACGGSSDVVASSPAAATTPAPAATLPGPGPAVPGSAGNSVSGFSAYLTGLSMSEEKAEASPIATGFSVPDDETSEPLVLS